MRKVTPQEYAAIHSQRVQDTFQLDPTVNITLKGVNYALLYDNWAVKELFKRTEINLLDGGINPEIHFRNPQTVSTLLLLGLMVNHPDISEAQVDQLLTFRNLPYILDRIKTAVRLFMPDMSDVEWDDGTRENGDTAEVDPMKRPTEVGSDTGPSDGPSD